MKYLRNQTSAFVAVILILALFRLIPHPPNATPIAAMALFSGAAFTNRWIALLIPIAAMLLSDLVLGLHSTMFYVYLSIVFTVFLGALLKEFSFIKVGIVSISASLIFYLITNFGAWLHHDMYPMTYVGLWQSYIAGLPFLRNSMIANVLFSYLIFYGLNIFQRKIFIPDQN